MSALEDAKVFMAWVRLVYGHSWSEPPPDPTEFAKEIARLLRRGKPIPPFAQAMLADFLDPPPGYGGELQPLLQAQWVCHAEIQNRTQRLPDSARNFGGKAERIEHPRGGRRNHAEWRDESMGVRKALHASLAPRKVEFEGPCRIGGGKF